MGGRGGEGMASSTSNVWKSLGLAPGLPRVPTYSETGTLTGEREEAVEGAAAQLILV